METRIVDAYIENPVSPGWALLISDIGVNPQNVLRRAGLPRDLFSGSQRITIEQFFALWEGIEAEADDPLLPLRFGKVISLEAFDVPMFAATCSPNLNVAARRLSQHKKLIGPQRLSVSQSDEETVVGFSWPTDLTPPWTVSITEIVFWVALVRLTTRSKIYPTRVTAPYPPKGDVADAYREYFGVPISRTSAHTVAFSAEDAARPFLTANDAMWQFFEPELRRRLSELEAETTTAERVRAALLEMLPAGDGSMAGVARELAMSTRTVQRRLKEEGTTFQDVLSDTRESLALHYLSASDMSAGEISFLLGYDDQRSFYRAFHAWTGKTPQLMRAAATS
jgi:AraC-like DNA-binding protein